MYLGKKLNIQVFDDLFRKIKTNYYKLGDKLPTESDMQELYGVSRAPVRQALGKLQSEGLIERRPGIGTVVINNDVTGPWPPMGGFSANLSKKWKQLQCKTIDVSKIVADDDVAQKLEIKQDSIITRVMRVRIDQDIPTFLLINYYENVDTEKIKEAGEILNMRQFANEVLGVDSAYVTEEIRAVEADMQTSFYLEVEEGLPILQIKRISYNENYKPVEYVIYYVKSEDWPYKVMYNKNDGDLDL